MIYNIMYTKSNLGVNYMSQCQICGKQSGPYPICLGCNELKNKGEVVKCENCGKWYKVEDGCCEKKQLK